MNDQTIEPAPVPTGTEPATTTVPTLDDVYEKYAVTPQAQEPVMQPPQSQVTATPAAQPAVVPQSIPSPVDDPDGFARYQASQHAQMEQSRHTANSAAQRVEAANAEAAQRAANESVGKVVDAISTKVEGVSKRHIKAELSLSYAEDARFRAIYDGRHTNPEAWAAAQGALTAKIQKEYAVKLSPQTEADQRAMTAAMEASPTANVDRSSTDAKAMAMSDGEFQQFWQNLRP